MRLALAIATATLVALAAPAHAATPVAPASGSSFTTTDTVAFEAEPSPDDSAYWFVFSTGLDLESSPWFAIGADGDTADVDLGWLAGKMDHIGTYWWALCPATETEEDLLTDQCSAPWSFSLRFRLPDLTRSQARMDARYVMSRRFSSYWRAGYNRRVSCTRVTRTRQRCRVGVVVGDIVVSGDITIYLKRRQSWANDFFRAKVRILDEYCYLVNKRSLSECQTVRRARGLVYGFGAGG